MIEELKKTIGRRFDTTGETLTTGILDFIFNKETRYLFSISEFNLGKNIFLIAANIYIYIYIYLNIWVKENFLILLAERFFVTISNGRQLKLIVKKYASWHMLAFLLTGFFRNFTGIFLL